MLSVVFRSNWEYLVDHADKPREDEQLHEQRQRGEDYYSAGVTHGKEPPGVWYGEGARLMGLEGEVSPRLMAKVYGKLEHPLTGEALGSRPRDYADRQTRLARALAEHPLATAEERAKIDLEVAKGHRENRNYIDAPFSPAKSVSVLYVALEAAGRHDEAEMVKASIRRTVESVVERIQSEASISRRGHHGKTVGGYSSGQYVEGGDLVVSLWDHTTSRNGDPQLHTHIAILNRVQCDDGEWRALHGAAIVGLKRTIGEMADRLLAEDLQESLGVRTIARADGKGWEIEGISQDDIDLWSSRSRGKAPIVAEWVGEYRAKHGLSVDEPVPPLVLDRMNQAAILLTRRPKPVDGKEMAEKLVDWESQYEALRGQSLSDLVERVGLGREQPDPALGDLNRRDVIDMAIAKVGETREVWRRNDLRAALLQVLPHGYLGRGNHDELMGFVDGLTDEALKNAAVLRVTSPAAVAVPDALKRSNGRSVYEPNDVERYATRQQHEGERGLLDALYRGGGTHMTGPDAERLIMETTAAEDQAAVLRTVLTSDRMALVVEAAAGTGKSKTMADLDWCWRYGVGGRVVGVTKSQNAAEVMKAEGVGTTCNIDKLLRAHELLGRDYLSTKTRTRIEAKYGLGPNDCLVIDEAGTVNDAQLMKLKTLAESHDTRMVLVGDTEQMISGAAFRLLATEIEPLRLNTVRRFQAEWEGPASLRLREGDTSVLAEYDRQGRIIDGSREEVAEKAVNYFVADHLAGKEALLVVATCDHADELAMQVREKLVELDQVEAHGVVLRNKAIAGVGNLVQARLNVRDFGDLDSYDPVVNRQVYRVNEVTDDGALVVRLQTGRDEWSEPRTLPADYVEKEVELAYAVTVMGAQGRTVDRGYTIPTEAMSLNHLYPAATRGRESNVILVPVDREQNERGVDVLPQLLERTDTRQSATEVLREEETNPVHLARLGPIYDGELGRMSRERNEAVLGAALGELSPRLAEDDASPALYRLLRSVELEGHDVETVVREAVEARELHSAKSVAETLHWRITNNVRGDREAQDFEPTRYGQQVPERTDEVTGYVRNVAEVMDERVESLSEQVIAERPQWAIDALGPVPNDPTERLEWSARAGEVAAYRERFGFDDADKAIGHAPGRGAPEQRAAWEQAFAAIGRPYEQDDTVRMSRGELLLNVQAYERIEGWMPPEVSDRLRTARIAQRDYEAETVQHRAAGRGEEATRSERLAEAFRTKAADFDTIDSVRREAEDRYAAERSLAERSLLELQSREPEQAAEVDVEREPDRDEPAKVVEHEATHEIVDTEAERAERESALERARLVAAELAEERQREEQERAQLESIEANQELELDETGPDLEID